MVNLTTMLASNEIAAIINPLKKAVKAANSGLATWYGYNDIDKSKHKKPLPKFSEHYLKANALREKMLVHYDISKIPFKLFEIRAPYEDDKQYEYRVANYEPITMPAFDKAIKFQNRILNKNNVGIDYRNEEQKKYYNTIPRYKTFFNFFEQIVLPQKTVDPNGVLGVRPFDFVFDDNGNISETERVSPLPKVYSSEEVVDFIENELLVIWSKEKSLVEFGRGKELKGNVFEIWDDTHFYRVAQVGKFTDDDYEVTTIYEHALGKLPAQKLKGQPIFDTLKILYQSYYLPAIPNLEIALYLNSNLDISTANQMFPKEYRYVNKCSNIQCEDGYIYDNSLIDEVDGKWDYTKRRKIECPDCKGKGTKHQGVMGVTEIEVPSTTPSQNNADITKMPAIPFGYVAPDPTSLEFVSNRIDTLISTAFANLNIDITEKVNPSTATEVKINRDEQINFLQRVSHEIYDLMQFAFDVTGEMRWGDKYEPVIINEPITFDIRTEGDLIEELKLLETANASPPIRASIELDFIKKRFSDTHLLKNVAELLASVNSLVGLTSEQIVNEVVSGRATKQEKIINDRGPFIIAQLIREDENFLERDFDFKRDKIKEFADTLVPEEREFDTGE